MRQSRTPRPHARSSCRVSTVSAMPESNHVTLAYNSPLFLQPSRPSTETPRDRPDERNRPRCPIANPPPRDYADVGLRHVSKPTYASAPGMATLPSADFAQRTSGGTPGIDCHVPRRNADEREVGRSPNGDARLTHIPTGHTSPTTLAPARWGRRAIKKLN